LFDSTASKLPQMAFRGVMHPAMVAIRRQEPDPAKPGEVQYQVDISDLGDFHGFLLTDQGESQHIAWAERAVLRYVADLDPRAASGLGPPRLTVINLYGRPVRDTVPQRLAVVLRMPRPVPEAEAVVERQLAAKPTTYAMRAAGDAISLYFDALGKLSEIKGLDEFDGDSLV